VRRGHLASLLLLFPMGADVVVAVYSLVLYKLLPVWAGTEDMAYVEVAGRSALILGWLALPLRLAAPIAYLVWFHLLVKSANAVGHDVGVTPNWAVRWWFIPLANLFKPFLIVRDLLMKLGGKDALSSSGAALWWASLMLYVVAQNTAGANEELRGAPLWVGRVVIAVLGFTSAFLAVKVIRTLNRLIQR